METTKDETITSIPNLWGKLDFNIDIPTPWEILSAQAAFLNEATNGLIIAEIDTFKNSDLVVNTLDLRIPELGNIKYSILQVLNKSGSHYPALINDVITQSKTPTNTSRLYSTIDISDLNKYNWMNYEEMSKSIKKILQSPTTIGIIESLLISVREKRKKQSME